ncbi:uncharacterized protein LOC121733497 [Aricia agestis]|uniref:uncharacterized protein LOC121733497 n=1 Tax=Aricia agestis TaxID=91739 RepID=UPI001C2051CE|nr:uncharacterized protein LOC121733497 [Aricia agestis]
MGCARGCSADKIFVFINIGFAMYAGALLSTAARLAWDPSTYAWFRFLCAAQYRVSAGFVLAAGLWLAALVSLAAATRARPALHAYCAGVACLAGAEVGYGAWMAASLVRWWRTAPQAELARRGADLLHDLKPALLAVERYRDVARPLYDMLEEVEREAPNNVIVIIVFGLVGVALQIAAFVFARRLARRGGGAGAALVPERADCGCASEKAGVCDEDSDSDRELPGWRKKANLRMYTILDKIF